MKINTEQYNKISFLYTEKVDKIIFKMSIDKLVSMDFILNLKLFNNIVTASKLRFKELGINSVGDKSIFICLSYIFGIEFYTLENFEFEWSLFKMNKERDTLAEIFTEELINEKIYKIIEENNGS